MVDMRNRGRSRNPHLNRHRPPNRTRPLLTLTSASLPPRRRELAVPSRAVQVSSDQQNTVGSVCQRYLAHGTEHKLLCTPPLVAAGPWMRVTFDELVPVSTAKIPVAPVVGHSLVVKNLQRAEAEGYHEALTPGLCERWSPDIISRVGGENIHCRNEWSGAGAARYNNRSEG